MANTKAFIKALRERVNEVLPTYYEEAPTKGVPSFSEKRV